VLGTNTDIIGKREGFGTIMIIISPHGGHGTSYLGGALDRSLILRPDTVFKFPILEDTYPLKENEKEWYKRTGVKLDFKKTIINNLYSLIKNPNKKHILFCGNCSINYKFLTKGNIKAYCIVRNPVDAYVSFYSHQHPEKAKSFGGFQTKVAIRHWARRWNPIITDFLESRNKIIRFEFFAIDAKNTELEFLSKSWDSNKRNDGELKSNLIEYMRPLVINNYQKLYGVENE